MSPPAAEHILLESDARDVPDVRAVRKSHARVRLHSWMHRRSAELAIADYYFLAVHRQHGRSDRAEYIIDLRFADMKLGMSRHVASRWLLATLGFALLFAGCAWWIYDSGTTWWQHAFMKPCLVLLSLTVASAFVCAYRTTETITVRSLHGRATLLHYEGGVGTFRRARPFLAKLVAHIQLASKARRSARAEHLRDEMREHFRLKEAGAIADEEYEASKARILGQHA
jgi:hypothetical protein